MELFEEKKPAEVSLQLPTKKSKQEIMHEYQKIPRNQQLGVFEFGMSGHKNGIFYQLMIMMHLWLPQKVAF